MAIQKVSVEKFLDLSLKIPVLDVRSPGEFSHAHIPDAYSIPLFSDEERKIIGTTYKQVSRKNAIKTGLDFFGPKMKNIVCRTEEISKEKTAFKSLTNTAEKELQIFEKQKVAIHCWRGGMRSGAVAWLLDLYGFEVYILEGGYKAFRNWALAQLSKDYNFKLIGGYTGSGKTLLLKELEKQGKTVIDLEGIACHKGSAFGGLDKIPQPSNEMFENLLAFQLFKALAGNPGQEIWLEDESQRIGNLNMPIILWNLFRTKPLYFLDVPFEQRLEYLTEEYGHYPKELLVNAIIRIQKRLGGLETKNAIGFLLENDLENCFSILLKYYDKHYEKALKNRPDLEKVMRKIQTDTILPDINLQKILKIYESE